MKLEHFLAWPLLPVYGLIVLYFVLWSGYDKHEAATIKALRRDCWSRERAEYGFEQHEDLPEQRAEHER
jgi:hypothetical protein